MRTYNILTSLRTCSPGTVKGSLHLFMKQGFFVSLLEQMFKSLNPPQPSWCHYLSRGLGWEGLNQFLHPVVGEDRGVEYELRVVNLFSSDVETVRHERVPVVKLIKLHSNAVLVLELWGEQQRGIKVELQPVTTQMLHIVLDHNTNGLTLI